MTKKKLDVGVVFHKGKDFILGGHTFPENQALKQINEEKNWDKKITKPFKCK